MKPFALSLVATLLVALGVTAAGCGDGGGGGELSLEEYFQKVEAVQNEADQAEQDAQVLLDEIDPAAPVDEQLATFREFIDAEEAALRDAIAGLAELEAPAGGGDAPRQPI